jgi:hypothetical protein
MDLCNKTYGFIHLPSLIVFVNPFSPHVSVRDKLLGGSVLDDVDNFVKGLTDSERVDFIQRFSSIFHERKHFHDLLITPLGNSLVRLGFKYALTSAIVFIDRGWDPQAEIEIPLRPESTKTAGLVARAKQVQQQFTESFHSARLLLEASATYAQLQFIWTNFGEDAALAAYADFWTVSDYSKVLDGFVRVRNKLSADFNDPWFATASHQLLLVGLGSDGAPAGHSSHDGFIADVLEKIQSFSPAKAKDRLQEGLKRGWDVVEANMAITDKDNEVFLESLEKMSASFEAVNESVVESFRDFCVKSKMARKDLLDNPDEFFSLERYVTNDPIRVGPLIYFYSDDDDFSLFPAPLDLETEDMVAQAQYKTSEDKFLYSHRLQPSRFEPRVELDKKAWVNFAKSTGGTVALMETLDWLHPFQSFWLRMMEPLVNVRFTRA